MVSFFRSVVQKNKGDGEGGKNESTAFAFTPPSQQSGRCSKKRKKKWVGRGIKFSISTSLPSSPGYGKAEKGKLVKPRSYATAHEAGHASQVKWHRFAQIVKQLGNSASKETVSREHNRDNAEHV